MSFPAFKEESDFEAWQRVHPGRHLPLSGDDLPGQYDGDWIPPSRWTYSASEAGGRDLAVVAFLAEYELRERGFVERLAGDVWRRVSHLRKVRSESVTAARASIRRGIYPQCPERLVDAQRADQEAFARFVDRTRPIPQIHGPLLAAYVRTHGISPESAYATHLAAFVADLAAGVGSPDAFARVVEAIRKAYS